MTEKQTCRTQPTDETETTEQVAKTDEKRDERADDEHLSDVTDGIGCVEVWEHLSEKRAEDD